MSRVFLLDVDNTLIDNDAAKRWVEDRLRAAVGPERATRFWAIYEQVREETGVVDYPRTLVRFRRAYPAEPRARDVERTVLGVPFERFLYPGALAVVEWLWTLGEPVILSDGDRVYQPVKIARAGLLLAARGNVLVYEHKEDHLAEVTRRFPADRYVHVDDKAALLSATKARLDGRATTVHVRQGHYASDPPSGPTPDIVLERIDELLTVAAARFDA